jgi:hypothetical protein
MNAEGYRAPSFRSIAGGCLLALLILAPLLFISTVVKWVGFPFLFLPQRLGLLPAATRADVRTIDLSTSSNQVDLPAAGAYLVYTDSFEILDVTLKLEQSNATPWLRVSDPSTGAVVPLTYVERGLMPFDPVFVPGRPIFRFVAGRPGPYAVEHITRNSRLAVIPDRTTGYEMQMLLAALVQTVLVVWLVGSLVRRRARERASRIEALLAPGRLSPKELQRRHSAGEGPSDNTRA